MIKIFVNVEEKIVEIYTETGLKRVEFEDADMIKNLLGDREVYYITGLTKTKAADITKLVYDIQGKIFKESKNYNNLGEVGEETVYLYNATKGVIFIPDINLTLRGGYDILNITDELKKTLQSSKLAEKLISTGKLKIIGNQDRRIALRKLKKEEKQRQSARDVALDSILGERDGDGGFIPSESKIIAGDGKGHDAIPVNITAIGGGGGGGEGPQSMEENLKNLEDLP